MTKSEMGGKGTTNPWLLAATPPPERYRALNPVEMGRKYT